jgi:hypothetical protein
MLWYLTDQNNQPFALYCNQLNIVMLILQLFPKCVDLWSNNIKEILIIESTNGQFKSR